jgi:plasmid stabilization system protein ParE
MDFEIIVKPEAEIDLDEAVLWYETELSGLGIRFYNGFENALERIVKSPNAFIEISPEIRRIIIKQFPYKVFYSVSGNKIFVIGIMHAKRSTGFIKNRLKEM